MTKINALFDPDYIKYKYNTNRRIKIEVATGLDSVTLYYMDRMFDYYVIDFKFDYDKNPKSHNTEETKATFTLGNDIDKFTVHYIKTNDQYVVWEALDKALSKDHLAPIHDIDGFLQLIPYIEYKQVRGRKRRNYRNSTDNCDATVIVYHGEDETDTASDFANAVALQVQIVTDRVTVSHINDRNFEHVIYSVPALINMISELKKMIGSDIIICKIVNSYNDFLVPLDSSNHLMYIKF